MPILSVKGHHLNLFPVKRYLKRKEKTFDYLVFQLLLFFTLSDCAIYQKKSFGIINNLAFRTSVDFSKFLRILVRMFLNFGIKLRIFQLARVFDFLI